MEPFFSIIIPTYNRAAHIRGTIRSFLQQNHPQFEIIVVDDGGKDETEAAVKEFADERIRYYYKDNGERGAARNFGAARARGQYLSFFDSDDAAYPYYLSHAEKELGKLNYPECFAQAFESRPEIPSPFPEPLRNTYRATTANDRLEKENFLACNGVFIRKDIFDRFRFSEDRDLSGSEDWVLWLRLSANYAFHYSPVICSCLVNHGDRGELNVVASKMIRRLHILLGLLRDEPEMKKRGDVGRRKVLASGYLFAALKLADFTHYKVTSIGYLTRAILMRPVTISQKNSYVTLKKLLSSWHSS